MLGTTANGFAHLLWIGGGQHEHHVRWWLFEGLQQGGLGSGAQHMHFVEDEHPMSARVTHSGTFDELANIVDAVVARGIEFEHVETGATFDREARVALTTGLAVR